MQYIGRCHNIFYLIVASNDNDDLLAYPSPADDLAFIRSLKYDMRRENMLTGMLLQSRKERRFFQEILDAERYILLRYFTCGVPESTLKRLKRYILDRYLVPKSRRRGQAGDKK